MARPQRAIDADQSTIPQSPRLFPLIEHGKAPMRPPSGQLSKTAPDPKTLEAKVTNEQWQALLSLIASGTRQWMAIEAVGVNKAALEGYLRADPTKYRAWREALIAADRLGWSVEAIEGICEEIANQASIADACAKWNKSPRTFLQIARRDPTVKEMYDEARVLATEFEADELRGIADDDAQDLTDDGKGGMRPNTAAVNRSKLRVETRLRLMAAFNRKRFADPKGGGGESGNTNVTVNINHADRLESARGRLRKVIEGSAVEVLTGKQEDDTSWLD